eukprot:6500289-Alexandrium_andersonii.AAC.1
MRDLLYFGAHVCPKSDLPLHYENYRKLDALSEMCAQRCKQMGERLEGWTFTPGQKPPAFGFFSK